MKFQFILALLAMLTGSEAISQVTRVAGPEQMAGVSFEARLQQLLQSEGMHLPMTTGKTRETLNSNSSPAANSLFTSPMGSASNVYSWIRPEQNQIWTDNELDLVVAIHRQDYSIWGGGNTGNGKFRYDISTNNGNSFAIDNGPLQSRYLIPGRYPSVTGYFNGTHTWSNANLVWCGPVIPSPGGPWSGHVYGYSPIDTSIPSPAETYFTAAGHTYFPGGLCQGLPGEFWNAEFAWNGSDIIDTLFVNKGAFDSVLNDVAWNRYVSIPIPFTVSLSGDMHPAGPNMAFSPDGITGWIAFVGDIKGGGLNECYYPIFIKSTNGGATWGNPVEVAIDSIPWMRDTLQTLWIDTLGNPASNGEATTAWDFDIVVDSSGNPHMGVVIGSGHDSYHYSISNLSKFLADVFSTDGGLSWDVDYLAPILRLGAGIISNSPLQEILNMHNYVQVSRTENGDKVFFSWVDSDTCFATLGNIDNENRNLRIAAKDLKTGKCTPWKIVSDGDLFWDGKIFFPSMSPAVLEIDDAFLLPIGFLEMKTGDFNSSVQFHFIRNAGLIPEDFSIFPNDSNYNQAWQCRTDSNFDQSHLIYFKEGRDIPFIQTYPALSDAFPNPADALTTISFELESGKSGRITISNIFGQQISRPEPGEFPPGTKQIGLNTAGFPNGLYFYTLQSGETGITKKLIVIH